MPNEKSKHAGYKNPPVEHRFSSTKQPTRRRKKRNTEGSADILQHIVDALDQQMVVRRDGKSTKMAAMAVMAQQLVGKTVTGSAADHIKLLDFLIKSGCTDFLKLREELEEQHRLALEDREEVSAQRAAYLAVAIDSFRESLEHRKLAVNAFLEARDKCSCEAFAGLEHAAHQIEEWFAEHEKADEIEEHPDLGDGRNWSPSQTRPAEAAKVIPYDIKKSTAADDDKYDPFYSGMINHS